VKDEAVGEQVVVFDDLALVGPIVLGDDATAECEPLNKVVEGLALVRRRLDRGA
jgi:hypothetical protein